VTKEKPATANLTPCMASGNGRRPFQAKQFRGESDDATLARASLSPVTQAALTLQQWQPMALEQDINALVTELGAQAAAASSNKLARMEAMLTTQAHTLDLIFNELARRARQNINEYPEAFERYLRLSLKAQSQCRSTIEGLAELKNPKPVAFVQQANIANGAYSGRI